MTSNINIFYDVLRVLACLMVIVIHAPRPDSGLSALTCTSVSLFCAPCMGLFFMISGALLLPVSDSYFAFLRRRLNKILFPTIVFSLFYIAVSTISKGFDALQLVRTILSIPFSPQGNGVLWFMYTLVGLYMIAPIISPFLMQASKRELQFILALWGITLCWPLLAMGVSIETSCTGVLFYFSGYLGYFVLGFYLHRFSIRLNAITMLLLFALSPVVYLFNKYFGWNLDFYGAFWYLGIFCVLQCVVWYQIVSKGVSWLKTTSIMNSSALSVLSKCTFGIYLFHIFFMRTIIWNIELFYSLHPLVQLVITIILTFILSLSATYIIAKTPLGKYVVGCRL